MKNKTQFSSGILLIVLFALTLGAYSNSFFTTFHYDDMGYVADNIHIRDLTNLAEIRKTLQEPTRFISFLSFAINYHFHKLDVFGYHLVNFLIHFFSGILVYFLVLKTLFLLDFSPLDPKKGKKPIFPTDEASWLSFLVAGLFLLHPLQTQAVTYITQRFTSLATKFYLGALLAYICGRVEIATRQWIYFSLALICAVLAFLSKEISFTLPAMIVLYEMMFIHPRQPLPENVRRVALFILIPLAIVVPMAMFQFDISHILLVTYPSMSHAGDKLNSWTYLLTQLTVIVHYLRLTFIPIGQVLVYDYPAAKSLFEPATFVSGCVLIALFSFGISNYARNKLIAFGIFWFFLALSIESSIFPIRNVIFEHRMYLPMVGVGFVLIGFMRHHWQHSRRIIQTSASVLIILALLTFLRNQVWKNEITLWEDVVRKSPNRSVSYANLGYAYLENKQYDKAIESINKSIHVSLEENPSAYNNAGLIYLQYKLYPLAQSYFDKAIAMNPLYAEAFLNRGGLFESQGEWEKALENYNKAITIRPEYVSAYINRGNVKARLNDIDGAFADYNEAIRLDSDATAAYINRGNRWAKMKEYLKAIEDYNHALKISPQNLDALNNRANAFNKLNAFDNALADYAHVLALNPQRVLVYFQRADLYVKMNRFSDALKDIAKAIDFNPRDPSGYLKRAEIYSAMGDTTSAQKDRDTAALLGVPLSSENE